jgi:hypothetical protein
MRNGLGREEPQHRVSTKYMFTSDEAPVSESQVERERKSSRERERVRVREERE